MRWHIPIIRCLSPRQARRVHTWITDALLWAGCPWPRRISLVVDALTVRAERDNL